MRSLKIHSLDEYPARLVETAMEDGVDDLDDLRLSHVEIGLELCTALVSLLRRRFDKKWKTARLLFCSGRVDVLVTSIMTLDNCECLELGDYLSDDPIDLDDSQEAMYFALAMGMPTTKSLKTLRLHGGISRQGSALMAGGLGLCKSIRSLELVGLIAVDEESTREFTRGILANTSIERISMIYSFPTLLQASVLQALEQRTISLDLFLHKEACPPIVMLSCTRLLQCNRLRKLAFQRVRVNRDHEVHELDFDHGFSVPVLANSLTCNTSLRELDVPGNCIRDNELECITSALKHNTTLEQLDLSMNEITDRGFQILADALPHLNLKRLFVHGNRDGEKGKQYLLEAMRRGSNLELLRVDSDSQSYEEIRLFGRLNRGGRRVLLDRNFPRSLWPYVLERANRLTFDDDGYNNQVGRAEVIYCLLHGVPNLMIEQMGHS